MPKLREELAKQMYVAAAVVGNGRPKQAGFEWDNGAVPDEADYYRNADVALRVIRKRLGFIIEGRIGDG